MQAKMKFSFIITKKVSKENKSMKYLNSRTKY